MSHDENAVLEDQDEQIDETLIETPDDQPDDEAVIVSIGEEPEAEEEPEAAPQWVKDLRKTNRELAKENRTLKQAKTEVRADTSAETLQKPTLESCEYDTDEFERKFEAFKAQEAKIAEDKRNKEAAEKAQTDAWNATLAGHEKAKAALKVPDYEDAEEVFRSLFNPVQQAVVVNGADNSAAMIYAIGKNEAKAKDLAAITDNVKFAFAIAKLETKLTITPKKTPPAPERKIGGSTPATSGVDSNLTKLRAEAEKTGDMSKVVAYKRDLRAKNK